MWENTHSLGSALAALALTLTMAAVAEQPAGVRRLTTGNTAFALELYSKVRANKGNVFVSPYSVSSALAMTYAGARGETAAEMARALRFGPAPTETHEAFRALRTELEGAQSNSVQLHIANRLWPRKGATLLPAYRQLTQAQYGATVTPLDYARAPEESRRTINTWVAERTRDKIKDLIGRGILTPATEMVLVNAIYFKGAWATQFDPKRTMDGDFTVPGAGPLRVPTMHRTGIYGYAETAGAKLLELPYAGRRLSMVIALPNGVDGIDALEKQLTPANLQTWLDSLREREVAVALPRFRITWGTHELNDALKAMGMKRAFTPAADFSAMNGSRSLFVGPVLHKAFVDVNEEGTEAAAATAIVMLRGAPSALRFDADHPFLFMIRDRETGSLLFIGRLVNPKANA